MLSKNVKIISKQGLHARPASEVVAMVGRYNSTVFIISGTRKANAGSIINVLTLGAKEGTELEIQAEGDDEQEALEAVSNFLATFED